jgi:hypothetical protein
VVVRYHAASNSSNSPTGSSHTTAVHSASRTHTALPRALVRPVSHSLQSNDELFLYDRAAHRCVVSCNAIVVLPSLHPFTVLGQYVALLAQ